LESPVSSSPIASESEATSASIIAANSASASASKSAAARGLSSITQRVPSTSPPGPDTGWPA
jgi:hypothetical protein